MINEWTTAEAEVLTQEKKIIYHLHNKKTTKSQLKPFEVKVCFEIVNFVYFCQWKQSSYKQRLVVRSQWAATSELLIESLLNDIKRKSG